MDLTEVLVYLKENAEAKVGARELREVYRSDFAMGSRLGRKEIRTWGVFLRGHIATHI